MNGAACLNTLSNRMRTLPIVILYVTAGCNLRCMTCSFRDPLPQELSLEEYRKLAATLRELGLRHAVFSGGEPLLRRDFPDVVRMFDDQGIRKTLLTNGLLLEKRIAEIRGQFNEIIVSIDGSKASTHDTIRGVRSFDRIVSGIGRLVQDKPRPLVSVRTVVQRNNFREIPDMVRLAKSLGVDRVSFLAADILSASFNRDRIGPVAPPEDIKLTAQECFEMKGIIGSVIEEFQLEISTGFLSEGHAKLHHLLQYFEALNGMAEFPRNVCNAPRVSAVINSMGEVLPCYFLPAYGNIRSDALADRINSDRAVLTRRQVQAYSLKQCQTCVCTLHVSPLSAILDVW